MVPKTYRLKIVQEGREFEAEGDKAFVVQMLKLYGPQAPVPGAPPGKPSLKASPARTPSARAVSGKSLSIREFVQVLDLKKHTDITLAFGYYLEKYQGVGEFSAADINNCYYEAKLEASNTSQMIAQNIKRGFQMPSRKQGDKGRNRYTLTRSGEQFIEARLQRVVPT